MFTFLRIVAKKPFEERKLDSDDDDDDIDENLSRSLLATKKSKKCSKNKRGRKAKWCESLLGDLVDIVISNDYCKTKLILTNTKNQKNGKIYKKVLVELKERAAVRNDLTMFSCEQSSKKQLLNAKDGSNHQE